MTSVEDAAKRLKQKFDGLKNKRDILKAPELGALYGLLKSVDPGARPALGKAINDLKLELQSMVEAFEAGEEAASEEPIDVTAPFDVNGDHPTLLGAEFGSKHPLSAEREVVADIFNRMGYSVTDSREIDDDYHMFGALNFPPGHPARDDYDTFVTEEGLIAPAHTSTMQNRVLSASKNQMPIMNVVIGRCFRNEDVDAKHEHTLNQIEGVYVAKGTNVGHIISTLKSFLGSYYQKDLQVKMQPAYFPFVEPGFEFSASCVFCDGQGCKTCGHEGWIELGGCGMIHPNVLSEGGVDPKVYAGFAWGFGLDRLAMMKYGIEDVRHFNSGKLEFLRQFK